MLFGLIIMLPIKEEEEVCDLFFLLIPTTNWNPVLLAWEEPEVETLGCTHIHSTACPQF